MAAYNLQPDLGRPSMVTPELGARISDNRLRPRGATISHDAALQLAGRADIAILRPSVQPSIEPGRSF